MRTVTPASTVCCLLTEEPPNEVALMAPYQRGLAALTLCSTSYLTAAVLLSDVGPPLRPILVVAYLLACPGLAVVLQLRLAASGVTAMALSILLSLSVVTLAATVMLYAGWWSSSLLMWSLLTVTSIVGLDHLRKSLQQYRERGDLRWSRS